MAVATMGQNIIEMHLLTASHINLSSMRVEAVSVLFIPGPRGTQLAFNKRAE